MKKYAKIITAILLVTLLALTFVACIDPDNNSQGTMTLVLLNGDDAKEYTVDLSQIPSDGNQTGLMAVLDYLQSDGQLTYAEEGGLLTQVGILTDQRVDGKYIYIYTDVETDFDVSAYAVQITYKEKSYTNSGFGASQMSIKDGCTIVITYLIWG